MQSISMLSLIGMLGLAGCTDSNVQKKPPQAMNTNLVERCTPYFISLDTNSTMFTTQAMPAPIEPERDYASEKESYDPTNATRLCTIDSQTYVYIDNLPPGARGFVKYDGNIEELLYGGLMQDHSVFFLPDALFKKDRAFEAAVFDAQTNCLFSLHHGLTNGRICKHDLVAKKQVRGNRSITSTNLH